MRSRATRLLSFLHVFRDDSALRVEDVENDDESKSEPKVDRCILIRGDTYTVCSCPLCGNPRKHRAWSSRVHWSGKTKQEHISTVGFIEQVNELTP